MSTNTIAERITQIIAAQLGIASTEIKPETHLANDLGADSLDEVEIVMELEDEFEIEIPDEDGAKLKTVQQAIDYITGRSPAQ